MKRVLGEAMAGIDQHRRPDRTHLPGETILHGHGQLLHQAHDSGADDFHPGAAEPHVGRGEIARPGQLRAGDEVRRDERDPGAESGQHLGSPDSARAADGIPNDYRAGHAVTGKPLGAKDVCRLEDRRQRAE